MICPVGGDPERVYGRPYDHVWCHGLQHPHASQTTAAATTTTTSTTTRRH